MNNKFSEKFGSHWVKVKFYEKEPPSRNIEQPKNIRFCEAVKLAVSRPVILSRENVSCESARYVFGWKDKFDSKLLDSCQEKCKISDRNLRSLLSDTPRLKKAFNYIGLNTDDEPDLMISCLAPQEMMRIIRVYNNKSGKNVEASLSSMMGLCGNIAVRTFLEENINISFGCLDSRKFAEIGRDRLVVGIPSKLSKVFI